MKLILILLFPFILHSQIKWPLNSDQDLVFDYYSRAFGTYFLTYATDKVFKQNKLLNNIIPLTVMVSSVFLERGLNGKTVSSMGIVGGKLACIIKCDIKYRKELKRLGKEY